MIQRSPSNQLPGRPIPATVLRSPHGGGTYIPVLSITVRALGPPPGVWLQPEGSFFFSVAQGGALTKRLMMLADWPQGSIDPIPVRANDMVQVALDAPVRSIVQSNPPPTPVQVQVQPGFGARFVTGHPVSVGNVSGHLNFATADLLTFSPALSQVPAVGNLVEQTVMQFAVDDAYPYQGLGMEIMVRAVSRNA